MILSLPGKNFDSQPSSVFKLILLPKRFCYELDVTWDLCTGVTKSIQDEQNDRTKFFEISSQRYHSFFYKEHPVDFYPDLKMFEM